MPLPSCQRRIVRARVSGCGGFGASALARRVGDGHDLPARPCGRKQIRHSGFWSVGQAMLVSGAGGIGLGGGNRRFNARHGGFERLGTHRLLAVWPGWRAGGFRIGEKTLGKLIQAPVKDSIASGNRTQKPDR